MNFSNNCVVFWNFKAYFGYVILTYPRVKLILLHETQSERRSNCIFRYGFNPFRWIIFASEIFPKDQTSFPLISIFVFSSTKQPLYCHRRDIGVNLSNFLGAWTNRNDPYFEIQRCFPVYYWITDIS